MKIAESFKALRYFLGFDRQCFTGLIWASRAGLSVFGSALIVAIDEFFKLPYGRKRIRAALGDAESTDTGGKTRRIGNVAAVLQVARRKRGGKRVSSTGRIGFVYIECRDHFPVQPVVDKKTAFSEPYDHIFVVNER